MNHQVVIVKHRLEILDEVQRLLKSKDHARKPIKARYILSRFPETNGVKSLERVKQHVEQIAAG